jgi:hypothetical protein
VSKVKGLKFDAWAHHPYPVTPNLRPLARVRYPNVTLETLPRFEKDLDRWFHRRVPIWITEYGHETKPAEPHGVTYAQQAAYAKQALTIARKDPNVQMFIWFTFRDSKGNQWQSGLEQPSGAHKPAFAAFSSLARLIDGTTQTVRAGVAPKVTMYVPYLNYYAAVGSGIGVTYKVYDGSKLVAVGQPVTPLRADQSITFTANFKPLKKHTYKVVAVANEQNGHSDTRTAVLQVS